MHPTVHAKVPAETLTWDALEPRVREWERDQEDHRLRNDVMNRILEMPAEELSQHLTMCHLSLEMARELGLTTPA